MAWPTVTIVTTAMDEGTDDPSAARAEIKQMADNVNAIKDSRSAASGIASLDSGGTVPAAELPIVPATKGGTGQSSYTVGDVLYANTTTTLTKLAAGTAGYALTSNGPGAAPSYQQVGGFPAGTRLSFQQTSTPPGWTKDTTAALNDSIMRIVTGTAGSGGSAGWSATTTTGATTLTSAQIPSHAHQEQAAMASNSTTATPMYLSTGTGGPGDTILRSSGSANLPAYGATALNTVAAGSGSSHTHPWPSIKYYDFIIASKD